MMDVAIEGASLAIYAAKKLGLIDKVISALRRKHRILVLGPTGVGKTTLIKSLTEWMPAAIDHMNRTVRAKKHRIKIRDDHFHFIDTPGQEEHSAIRTKAIDKEIAKVSGILNVVAYGYLEYRRDVPSVFAASGQVSRTYLKNHRQLEVDMVSEWTSRVLTHRVDPWIMTVISKADYWFDNRLYVYNHYADQNGDYAAAINAIPRAQHSVHEYCGTMHKFYKRRNIQSNFDQSDARDLKSILLADLIDAIGRL